MSEQYTPEPWVIDADGRTLIAVDSTPVAEACSRRHWRADAERIRACISACVDLPDPEVAIPALVQALQALIFPMEAWNEAVERVTGEQPVVNDALIQARAALALVEPKS